MPRAGFECLSSSDSRVLVWTEVPGAKSLNCISSTFVGEGEFRLEICDRKTV
jgi:hypothetical protein